MVKELKIKELDLSMLSPNEENSKGNSGSKYAIVGKPGTGKSTVLTSIMYHKRHIIPNALIISGTEDSNGHYSSFCPSLFIHSKFDDSLIENFIKRQKIAKQYCDNPWSFLVLDDCTDDVRIFNKPLMQSIYKNGRHWKMMYILSLQYCMDVKPVVRTNTDGIFILKDNNIRNRKALFENYCPSCIPDFRTFCQLMDALTEDYTCLFINNQGASNEIEDCIFYYKAPLIDTNSFKLGCPDAWKFHYNRIDKNSKMSF